MTDAVALVAISQLICLGALFYLARQLQRVRGELAAIAGGELEPASEQPQPAHDYGQAAAGTQSFESASLAERINELGLDIPALARRMQRSEQEVRLLLRDYGVRQ